MKSFFRFIVEKFLIFKAKQRLRRSHVQIIAITGSVGKTSTKEAIYQVLKKQFKVYRSKKSFNTPIGLCLTILQQSESGFSSPLAWFKILFRICFNRAKMPEILILEMGADHPGDIQKLIKIAKPHFSIITHIKPVHLGKGQFKNLQQIAREKSHLIRHLKPKDVAILNDDDFMIHKMNTAAKVITYGKSKGVILRASHLQQSYQDLSFQVRYGQQKQNFKVPVFGEFQVYVFLPAIAIGLELGLSLKACAKALSKFKLPPGRMNALPGLKGSHLIDSSYNASPTSMEAALQLLDNLPAPRKIAALGSMNELGATSEKAHLKVGQKAGKVLDLLVLVGPEAHHLKQGALEGGMKEACIFSFADSKEAGRFLKAELKEGDVVLIKGSQNQVRMEHCVKRLMKYPQNASRLLCRQEPMWKKIPL